MDSPHQAALEFLRQGSGLALEARERAYADLSVIKEAAVEELRGCRSQRDALLHEVDGLRRQQAETRGLQEAFLAARADAADARSMLRLLAEEDRTARANAGVAAELRAALDEARAHGRALDLANASLRLDLSRITNVAAHAEGAVGAAVARAVAAEHTSTVAVAAVAGAKAEAASARDAAAHDRVALGKAQALLAVKEAEEVRLLKASEDAEEELSAVKAQLFLALERISDLEASLALAVKGMPAAVYTVATSHKPVIQADELEAISFLTVDAYLTHLRTVGLTSAQLVFGIDCTKSNLWTGKKSFGGRSLHDVTGPINPYQQVMGIFARVLGQFDDDGLIPLLGFGDRKTTDQYVFSMKPAWKSCEGIDDVLATYAAVLPTLDLAGPTSFAPLIRRVIDVVKKYKTPELTVLLICADGQVTATRETEAAIVEASKYPISIICVGVGDGPWDDMYRFDDDLPARKVDNFQFVDLARATEEAAAKGRTLDDYFALSCLAELPEQIKAFKKLRILP